MSHSAAMACLTALLTAALHAGCSSPEPAATGAAGGSGAPSTSSSPTATPRDACSLLTQEEIAAAVGNPVQPGRVEGSSSVCDWDAQPDQTDVLLMVYLKGTIREQALCPDLRKAAAAGKGYAGIGEAATWKFTKSTFFNSGDLELCDAKGFVSLSVNGKGDAATLEAAAVALARKVLSRL